MADVASLAVGLHLNAANFKSQLLGAYGDAENQSKRFNRNAQADAKKTEDAYKKVGLSISGMASRLAGLAGTGLSISTIITTSRQYGQALSDLQAITGATADEMKALDLAAQEMGRTTEYSASQAAEALKLMASAKPELLKTSDGLQQATNSALILAQAAGTTLPDATRTLALSLNQYGASAQEADRYINVLAAGAKYGSSEITDTAAAIKNGGVAAAQAGVGFEQLNAAIQVLAEREVKGGQAGTALRNVILNLEKGTDKSLKPSVVGLSQALTNLSGKNLSTAQAVKLFGVENLNAASILVQNRSKIDELTASLTGTKTAHEQASIRVNNLNGDLLGLSSAFEGMVIKIGQSSNGPLRSGIQTATEALNGLADNFNTVSSIALYSLIPVLSTKLTAGLRENIAAWRESQAAVKARALADADIARKTLDSTAAILTNNKDRMVEIDVGLDGKIPQPGYIIGLADELLAGRVNGGRISAVNGRVITLDRDTDAKAGDRLQLNLPSGISQARTIQSVNGRRQVTVTTAYSETPEVECVWVIESDDLYVQQYRVIGVKDNNNATYTITGVAHDPDKFPRIDTGAIIDQRPISVIPPGNQSPPENIVISSYSVVNQGISVETMQVHWNAVKDAISYEAQWRRNDGNWITGPGADAGGDKRQGQLDVLHQS